MSIFHWKLGDIAQARLCKKVYAKVKVVKNEDGIFHDEKGIKTKLTTVLGISPNKDGSISATKQLCYHVEVLRRGDKLWLPYTSLHLAERSRPFYGINKELVQKPAKDPSAVPRKRKIKEDIILPLQVKLSKKEPDLNTTYDKTHAPLKQGKFENAFLEFVRRGKEMLFDHFYYLLERDDNTQLNVLDYIKNIDASTEDKFEMIIKDVVTEKEIESYLHQCWRYNFMRKQTSQADNRDGSAAKSSLHTREPITVHIPWCLVCGRPDRLKECPNCPSSFHMVCRREWLVTIIHRKNPPKKPQKPMTLVKKILSSTRTIVSRRHDKENMELCPSCMWGPRVGYDDVVWHKLSSCPWWPARVLAPGETPACLLSRSHAPTDWPLRYYGTLNHSWASAARMCLFLPSHTAALSPGKDPDLQEAVLNACDDYIAVYLK